MPRSPFALGRVVYVVALAGIAPLGGAQPTPTFRPLGFVPGASTPRSEALAVSRDGCVVGGLARTLSPQEGFIWTSGSGLITIGVIPTAGSPASAVHALADDGRTATGLASAFGTNVTTAYRWTESTGIVALERTNLPTQQAQFTDARGISGDGRVIVGTADGTSFLHPRAARWDHNGALEILTAVPDRSDTRAWSADHDGDVIVGWSEFPTLPGMGDAIQAFRWTPAGGVECLGFLAGRDIYNAPESKAFDCSADGSIVVGHSRVLPMGSTRAFRWSAATGMVRLDPTHNPAGDVRVAACSARANHVVGLVQVGAAINRAFLWTPQHGVRTIEEILQADYGVTLPGWTLTRADGISADGHTIVGSGTDPHGRTQAWLLTLPSSCPADLTTGALPGNWEYGIPDGVINTDDFFFYLSQFAALNRCVADMTNQAMPGSPGYGTPNGLVTNDDFFYYLTQFSLGCP